MFIVRTYNNSLLKRWGFLPVLRRPPYSKAVFKNTNIFVSHKHDLSANVSSLPVKSSNPVNKYIWRTHTCGELSINNIGDYVKLYGWLEFKRLTMFILLRDTYGITQVFVPEDREDVRSIIETLPFESVLCITGEVRERPDKNKNPEMQTGEIEIQLDSLEVLNTAKKTLPLYNKKHNKSNENLQMQYRYIALRDQKLQENLRLRSYFISDIREYLIKKCQFVDIETPTLFKNTPGGAQEFVVPTQHCGLFYSLVQSPQQLKQLLMIGGCDRYFQIARCYRDETSRFDRQPEFTQLDIEMSFVDCSGVMGLVEDLLSHSWPKELGNITTPFQRITYHDVMRLYGTDKPDLRIPYQLQNITENIDREAVDQAFKMARGTTYKVYALTFPKKAEFLTSNARNKLYAIQKEYYPDVKLMVTKTPLETSTQSSKTLLHSSLMKPSTKKELNITDGDAFFLAVGKEQRVQEMLGTVRTKFADVIEECGSKIRTSEYKFLWVTDFPLFSRDRTTGILETMHHPFTQPHPEDIQHLYTEPEVVRGLHYDLVINGAEIGGGSIRIHDAKLQKQIFEMLNIPCDNLDYMLEALECGAPPHGGIALGIDRLMCILCNERSIKNVIAFPKTMEGRDLLSNAPSPITEEEMRLYHLRVNNNRNSAI